MASKCPNCGAHLSLVLAGGSTNTSAPAAIRADTSTPATIKAATAPPQSKERKQPNGAKPPAPPSPATTEADIQRLKEIMCAPLTAPRKPQQRTLRPVVSKEPNVGALTDRRSLITLGMTARRMQAGIRRAGERSVDTLLEARRHGRVQHELPGKMELVLEALGAIVYDMEWTADTGRPGPLRVVMPVPRGTLYTPTPPHASADWYTCRYVFELMLSIDYGLPAYPLRGLRSLPKSWILQDLAELELFSRVLTGAALYWSKGEGVPSTKAWDYIARVVGRWAGVTVGVPVWDIATMLYYYNTRSKPVSAEDHKQGRIGYTGILQEMISEIASRGPARLERKLSLDVHLLIPKLVRDREKRILMMTAARDLAAQHGCHLGPFEIPKPPVWRRCCDSLAGRHQLHKRLGDDEDGSEKEKLIGGKGEGEPG